MRLFQSRFLRNTIEDRRRYSLEQRDAIVWDVVTASRRARVKLQGSNTLIIAHYQENFESIPIWLKPGNAVKVVFNAGRRDRVEIVGSGQTVPTPIAGNTFPTASNGVATIISGFELSASSGMTIAVAAGTYRVDGVVSAFAGTTKTLDAAPGAGDARYDLLVLGADGVVDIVKGTANSSPVKPSVTTGHLLIGYVLVPGGVTAIKQEFIDKEWVPRIPTQMMVSANPEEINVFGYGSDITLQVYDQYGVLYSSSWNIDVEIVTGDGDLSDVDSNGTLTFSGSSTTFTYTTTSNSQLANALYFTLQERPAISTAVTIVYAVIEE